MRMLETLGAIVDDIHCTRCGRHLRHPHYANGQPFGSVCITKTLLDPVTWHYEDIPVKSGVVTLPDGSTRAVPPGVHIFRMAVLDV